MALSRLRQPVISRAHSLFKARLLSFFPSSSRSLSRTSRAQNSNAGGQNFLLRPTSLSMLSGVQDKLLNFKQCIGVQYFSTVDTLHTVLGMPALSPTMNQGNIAKWRKKERDKVSG